MKQNKFVQKVCNEVKLFNHVDSVSLSKTLAYITAA